MPIAGYTVLLALVVLGGAVIGVIVYLNTGSKGD